MIVLNDYQVFVLYAVNKLDLQKSRLQFRKELCDYCAKDIEEGRTAEWYLMKRINRAKGRIG